MNTTVLKRFLSERAYESIRWMVVVVVVVAPK